MRTIGLYLHAAEAGMGEPSLEEGPKHDHHLSPKLKLQRKKRVRERWSNRRPGMRAYRPLHDFALA